MSLPWMQTNFRLIRRAIAINRRLYFFSFFTQRARTSSGRRAQLRQIGLATVFGTAAGANEPLLFLIKYGKPRAMI
jgi:hypothetical protein